DQAMVNAFTTGFRVAQIKTAVDKSLSDPVAAAAALESAQVVALGILVREAMQPAQFETIYRPFATILPGPGFRPAAPIDQQIATANQMGRTIAFRATQDSAEQAAPHDGLGIVGFAGVAAGAIFMRDVLPIEKVLILYEPFASVFPYESLA